MPITAEEKIKLVRLKIFQNCLQTYRTAILTPDPSNGHRLLTAPGTSESFLHYVENDRVKVSMEERNDPKAIAKVFLRGIRLHLEHLWESSYGRDNEKFPRAKRKLFTRLIAPSKQHRAVIR